MGKSGWQVFNWARLRNPPDMFAAIIYSIAILFVLSSAAAAAAMMGWALSIALNASAWDKDSADELSKVLIALAGLVGAPFVVWRVLIANRQNFISQENLYTAMLAKAVEQLGATREEKNVYGETLNPVSTTMTVPNIEMRLGAIYALDKLARDYLPLHWPIMEILCGYVRENAPVKTAADRSKPRTDIQAVLNVIGGRSQNQMAHESQLREGEIFTKYQLNLSETNLRGAHIRGCFTYSDFRNSVLDDAQCTDTAMHHSDFSDASMRAAMAVHVDFSRSYFWGSSLNRTEFAGSNFSDCRFKGVNMTFAKLSGVNFRSASAWMDMEPFTTDHGCASAFLSEIARAVDLPDSMLKSVRLAAEKEIAQLMAARAPNQSR